MSTMSRAPSLNSLTNFESCRGSDPDTESVLSYTTFKSVKSASLRSGSTKFYSDESDSDTAVGGNDTKDFSSMSETFFDVESDQRGSQSDIGNNDSLIAGLSRLNLGDTTSAADLYASSPSQPERVRLLYSDDDLVNLSNPSQISSANHSTSSVTTELLKTEKFRRKGIKIWVAPILVNVLISSLIFQSLLRVNANLCYAVLTFWRSVVQLVVATLGLLLSCQSPFGLFGSKLKLLSYFLLTVVAVTSTLLASSLLRVGDLAAIFLNVPIGTLFVESAMRRATFPSHVALFVMVTWISAILLLTGNTPWSIQLSLENRTGDVYVGNAMPASTQSNTSQSTRWPPIFALDNVHMWPIQSTDFTGEANAISNVFGSTSFWPGLAFGFLALAVSSVLPTLASSCSWTLFWPLITWQAIGGLSSSLFVIFVSDHTFLYDTSNEWFLLSGIVATSIVGNSASLLGLGLKEEAERLGQIRTVPAIPVGIVSRSALEIVIIFGANLLLQGSESVSIEEGCGIALLILTAFLCCLYRPAKST